MTGTRTCSSPTGRNPPHESGIWCHPVYAVRIPCLPCEETQPPPFHLSAHLHNIHHQLHACDPSGPASCLMEEALSSENTKHKRLCKEKLRLGPEWLHTLDLLLQCVKRFHGLRKSSSKFQTARAAIRTEGSKEQQLSSCPEWMSQASPLGFRKCWAFLLMVQRQLITPNSDWAEGAPHNDTVAQDQLPIQGRTSPSKSTEFGSLGSNSKSLGSRARMLSACLFFF